jgi:hypothetical protein
MSTATIDTLTIRIAEPVRRKLAERAAQEGKGLSEYVEVLLEREAHRPSIEEILAPFRQQVEASGMTDVELEQFFEGVRNEVWQEKQAAKRGSE